VQIDFLKILQDYFTKLMVDRNIIYMH